MHTSKSGIEMIQRFEGFRTHVYRDIVGNATIGYGHLLLPHESFPNGIDELDAVNLLMFDIGNAEKAIERLVKVSLSQNQFDALVDFVFNVGEGRFASSTLLHYLNAGNYDKAAEQLLVWNRAGSHIIHGLDERRKAELYLWCGRNPTEASEPKSS